MKVGHLMSHVSRYSAGIWSVVDDLTDELVRLPGTEASIFGLDAEDTPDLLRGRRNAEVVTRHVLGPQAIGYAPGLADAVSSARLDVLHSHGLWMLPSRVALHWSRETGRPHVVSPHGMLDPWALRNSRWKKQLVATWYEDAHLKEATCLHALCQEELEGIRAYGLTNPVCVIPNGVTLSTGEAPARAPWQGLVEEGKRVLLYIGRLHPKKGVALLLEALGEMRRRNSSLYRNWVLVIIGWDQGGYAALLRERVSALGLEQQVRFLGPLYGDDKAAALSHADAFVLPSLSEGLPMAVLEAWAYGLPVIMTPECHLPEGFTAGAAIEVTADPESLANGLCTLFERSDEDREAMGQRGKELVRRRFTWPTVATQMREVYAWLAGDREKPDCVSN